MFGHAGVPVPSIKVIPNGDLFEQGDFLTAFIEGDQLYLNIPETILDKPMLFVCYYGRRRSHMQVVWSLQNDKILLKPQSIRSTAGIILPVAKGLTLMDNVLAT
ncbi:hypothetical protein SAMN06265377_3981, partial [Flagellimonas pacifica]